MPRSISSLGSAMVWPWVFSPSTGVKSPSPALLFPPLGVLPGQCWHRRRIFLLVHCSHSLCETTVFSSFRVSCVSEYQFLQYTNVWYSAYLPLVSSHSFDNTGKQYNVSQIINVHRVLPSNLQLTGPAGPIFLSASFAITYGLSFATITATFTHTFLYYRKYIWTHARRPFSQQPDIYARLMSVYREVPDWWYLTDIRFDPPIFIIKKVC